jgi:diguanylate cyclase (GGDEF)-like protein/PAS domain S-box-containing protein
MNRNAEAERLQNLLLHVPGILFQFQLRPDGGCCLPFANQALLNIYRVKQEDVREDAASLFLAVHPDDLETHLASIHTSALELTPWVQEYRLKFGEEPDCWLLGNAMPQRLEDGSTLWHGYVADITRRKLAEQALQREKAIYQRTLLDNFPFAVWIKDTQSRFLSVNRGFAQIFGFNHPDELVGKTDFDIAPDHLAAGYVADDLKVLASRQNQHVEELILTQGALRWFETYKAPVMDADGEILGSVGFARDITARKLAEENLHLAASVFSHAREGIMITKPDGAIIDVNIAFTRITGYSREEVLGRNPRIFSSGPQGREAFAEMLSGLHKQGYWHGEVLNRRKDGELYYEMLTISSVKTTAGEIGHYVALFSDITALKEQQRQLEYIAHYDALTHLPNRVLLADRLQQGMAQAQRHEKTLAVVYLDLDGFKRINDNHGHEIGDELLISVTAQMKQVLREVDTLARFGGDEFVAVLLDLESSEACAPLLARLLAAAAMPLQIDDLVLKVSASLGVTFYPQTEEVDADQLFRQADQAMYQAKLLGKNRYHFFDPKQDSNIRGHHESLNHIRLALNNQEFVLYYQPKVNMRNGDIIGVEALIRWNHPEKGLLSPAMFLPVVEDHPLAVDIGEWVIDTGLRQLEIWRALGLEIQLSVNVSARQLQQADFIQRLQAILAMHPDIPPADLELEVLETSALEDIKHVSGIIHACRAIGVRFSLDDFGTGYSSLTYLKRLPVTLLKIDQSFVRDMLDDPDDLAILEGVIGLASAFGRDVIAEGVETVAHGELLLRLGCELAQGYGIARPMPAAELPVWAKNWRTYPNWANQKAVSRETFPLLFTTVEHRTWLKALRNFISGPARVPPPALSQCRFTQWLDKQGRQLYAGQAEFATLQNSHLHLHSLAAELCWLKADQQGETALLRLDELENAGEDFLKQVKFLILEKAGG